MLKLKPLLFAGIVIAFSVASAAPRARCQEPTPAQTQQPAPSPAPAPTSAPAAAASYPRNPIKPTSESQTRAKNLYQIDCAMCHGDNGNGKTDLASGMGLTLVDWTDPKSLDGRQDGELFNVIRNGKDKMPPEDAGRAKDDQVWNLVVYIRSFSKGQLSAPSTAAK
jgi:mono/diheme cytochrome c family protein